MAQERDRSSGTTLRADQSPYQTALAQLATLDDVDPRLFIAQVLEVDARLMSVARVSYWSFTENGNRIICDDLYELAANRHSGGEILEAARYPRYFAALREARALVAEDARTDPRTNEFREGYLIPNEIVSMLDAPVRRGGDLIGIVCHEHGGERRAWTEEDESFAASVADAIALVLATAERDQIAARLREREKQLSLIARRIPAVIWTTDVAMNVTSASGAALGPIGLRPEVLAGTSVDNWLEGVEPRDELMALHRRAIAGTTATGAVHRNRRHLEVHLEPFRNDEDEVVGAIGLALDITERYVAEQQRERIIVEEHRALEEARRAHANASFLAEVGRSITSILDEDQCARAIADVVCPKLADWSVVALRREEGPPHVVGSAHRGELARRLNEVLANLTVDPEAPDGISQVIRTRRPVLHAIVTPEMLSTDGPHWPIFCTRDQAVLADLAALGVGSYLAVPLMSGDRVLATLTLVRTTAESPYGAAEVELATEVAARAAAGLERASLHRAVVDAVRIRDEFLSIAAHELYTPLTTLELTLQTMRRGLVKGHKIEADTIETAVSQGRRLVRLVGELLDVARVDARRLELHRETVDLTRVTREIVAAYPPSVGGKQVRISLEVAGPVVGQWDRTRIEQVVSNIIGNAVKYGRGKPIVVRVAVGVGEAIITVRDHGIGIAKTRLPHVFERFERATSGTGYSGLGLGLYIVKTIVEAHAGRIDIDSEPNVGTTVTVRLPTAPFVARPPSEAVHAMH
jgi:PAS domain S-box-containing protein